MLKKLSLIFTVLTIVSMLFVPAIYADGSIAGIVYGNGSVSVTEGEGGVTFTFTPGAANELKSFTVDGSAVTVTDNQATVPSATAYEAVFEGKAVEVTREIKHLMENGAVAENGLSATDSVNKLTVKWTSNTDKTQPVATPVAGQYGYLLSRNDCAGISKEKWEINRSVSDGGLVNVASGRRYTAGLYFMNTHKAWGNNVWGNYHIYTGYLNGGSEKVFVNNCESSWRIMSETLTNKGIDKDAVTKIPLTPFAVSSINQEGGAEITDKSAYSTLDQITVDTSRCGGYSGGGGGLIYVHGVGFKETVSYHTVTANIGEGEMTFSSESLNFGKDNDSVKVKNGVALAVEDKRPATFTVTAPSGKTVKEVKFGEDVLEAAEGVYTIPCVSENGAITVTYEDNAPVIPSEYDKKFDFSSYDSASETQVRSLTPYSNGTVTFEFYDNGVTGGLVAFKDGSNILSEYLKLYSDGKYTFVADRGTAKFNGTEVKLDRTAGAHKMVIKTFGDSYDVYFDNNLVHSITLAENSIGVRDIYVQNKDNKYTAGTSHELYYKTLTSAENKPSVSSTSVIANSTYNGQPSAVIYAKVEGDASKTGIILKDSEGNALTLNAYNSDGESLVTTGAFGIRVFGAAMVRGNEYKYVPFAEYAGGSVNADEQAFTLE